MFSSEIKNELAFPLPCKTRVMDFLNSAFNHTDELVPWVYLGVFMCSNQ